MLAERSPGYSVALTAGRILASNPVRFPSCTLSMAPLIAPQAVCPITRTTFAPATLHANSMLSEDVVVGDVAGHARVEGVADTQVHDGLGGRARVDAAQDHRRGILTFGARLLLSEIVVRRLSPTGGSAHCRPSSAR